MYRFLISMFSSMLLMASTGCTLVSNLVMPIALIRSPVTLDSKVIRGNINGPLSEEEVCRIKLISNDISKGRPRSEAVESRWDMENEKPCVRYSEKQKSGFDHKDEADNLRDLLKSDVLVLIAMSGGGSRAAALAAHTMSLLEKEFNRLQENLGISSKQSLLSLIDAFSTVSGGSLYAYQVGRSKIFLNLAKEAIEAKVAKEDKFNKPMDKPDNILDMPINSRVTDCSGLSYTPVWNEDLLIQLGVWERCFFSYLAPLDSARSVGIMGAKLYLSPANFFFWPLVTFVTDINYLDILAGGLAYSSVSPNSGLLPPELRDSVLGRVFFMQENPLNEQQASRLYRLTGIDNKDNKVNYSVLQKYNPWLLKLGDLPKTPRFFFNTTSLENGLPFVLTQHITHFSSDTSPLRTVRLDTLAPHSKPLSHAYTLEEINSSPSTFPLAHAAMASAAFPLGLEPLEVIKYGYREGYESLYPTQDRLHLTDGGVFDNSGLTTLSDLVQYLTTKQKEEGRLVPKTIILVSINAEADDYNLEYPRRAAEQDWWINTAVPFSLNFPLRTGALGIKALEAIHFTNKRRAEEIAVREVMHLVDLKDVNRGVQLLYFPIAFSQLSESDRNKIDDPDKLYSRLKALPTSFGISSSDELLIEQAASSIISSRQINGWPVGPKCSHQDSQGEYQQVYRGGSGWLDSFYQFISGAWRIADDAAVCRVVR